MTFRGGLKEIFENIEKESDIFAVVEKFVLKKFVNNIFSKTVSGKINENSGY